MRDTRPGLVDRAVAASREGEAEVDVLVVEQAVRGIEAAHLVEGPASNEQTASSEIVDDPCKLILRAVGPIAVSVAGGRSRTRQ
jgi:hypothetical protein